MADVMALRRGPQPEPLVRGGTPVDDIIMDLLVLAELCERNPSIAFESLLRDIEEMISVELYEARVRSEA